MPSQTTIARLIAETINPETRGTIRDMIASTRYPVDGPADAAEIAEGLAFADRVIALAAERIVQGERVSANDR